MSAPVTISKVYCDFCGKMQDFVQHIVAGRNAHICDECVDVCTKVVHELREQAQN